MGVREALLSWSRGLRRAPAPDAGGRRTPAARTRGAGDAPGAARRVLLVAGADDSAVQRWRDRLVGEQVRVVPASTGHAELRALLDAGPVSDLVVVLRSAAEHGRDQGDLAALLLPTVRRGGQYVLDRRVVPPGDADALRRWVEEQQAVARTDSDPSASGRIGHAIGAVEETADELRVAVRRTHLLVVRDDRITEVLPAREPGSRVEVLDQRPEHELVASTRVVTHGFGEGTFPERMTSPRLETRLYLPAEGERVAVGRRALTYLGETVLPESFRWHLAPRPSNHGLAAGPRPDLRRVRPKQRPTRHLPGTYYHLDSAHGYHFGHLTTESVSRLWGWQAAKAAVPDLKAVLVHWRHGREVPSLPGRLFAAYGIDPDDVVWVEEPVTVDALVGATPMWHQTEPFYVHPDLAEVWERIAHGLTDGRPDAAPTEPVGERIFVSRGSGAKNRACRNQDEVERFFAARGFHVLYPEEHPLEEQVRIFRQARVVAGFGGSGLFNMMYSRRLERLIVLNHEGYVARNEHMFSAVLGNEQHYFWSASDRAQPEGGFSTDAFRSGWEFDFDRNATDLDAVLGES